MGRWLKAARKLLATTSTAPPKGLWLFSSGPASDGPHDPRLIDGTSRAATRLGAEDNVTFSGDIELSRLGRAEGVLVSAMKVASGDFRDFSTIERWADEIARELSTTDTARSTAEPTVPLTIPASSSSKKDLNP